MELSERMNNAKFYSSITGQMIDEWAKEVAQLEAGNEQLIQILQELEWQGHDAMSDVCCPSCGGFKPNDHGGGHYENCRLKEALGVEKSSNF